MIALLTGTVREKTAKTLTLVAGAVGYEIYCLAVLLEKTRIGDEMTLYTHQYVREDALELYGFATSAERSFFRLLISVTGVGPKSALTVMSLTTLDELEAAIIQGDAALLTKVSGIGTKTASRIIVDLKGKIASGSDAGSRSSVDGDAIDALVGLGYSVREAREVLKHVADPKLSSGQKVQAALKLLGTKQ
ncbi:MAG: Holliday junction branch migration protein RuvA [Candidatus Kerfeldbacteria bacterium]|nr:Holliday junction branch migration protein RuvA [Candidatus Kerfeldbacteria bacterium]